MGGNQDNCNRTTIKKKKKKDNKEIQQPCGNKFDNLGKWTDSLKGTKLPKITQEKIT